MKGLTTLGGLAKGVKALGRTGLKGMALGVKGLGKGTRLLGRQMKKLFTRGDPIDMATGEMVMSAIDVSLDGSLPLVFERHFRAGTRSGRLLGRAGPPHSTSGSFWTLPVCATWSRTAWFSRIRCRNRMCPYCRWRDLAGPCPGTARRRARLPCTGPRPDRE
ncbi:hypothetical protein SHIRM173S_02107 [Streptomyces hirsutus]